MNKVKPDIFAVTIGSTVLILLLSWLVYKEFSPIYLVAVGAGLGSIILYLVLKRYKVNRNEIATNETISWAFIFGSLAFCLLAWLVFIFRSEQYVKPLFYYMLMACATGLAFYGVLKSKNKTQTYIVVGIACIIGLSHIWTEHIMFPSSLIGLDPWVHRMRTLGEPRWTYIGSTYSLIYPYLKHTMEVFGISYKWASLIFVGSLQTIGIILFTFLLGRRLWNMKVGCIASLMVASANWVIFFGEWIIPNGLGATYSLAVAYFVLRMNKGDTKWLLVPVGLIILMAYATHFIALAWVWGTFACLWIVPVLFNTVPNMRTRIRKVAQSLAIPTLWLLMIMMLLQVTSLGAIIKTAIGEDIFAPEYEVTHAVGKTPNEVTSDKVPGDAMLDYEIWSDRTMPVIPITPDKESPVPDVVPDVVPIPNNTIQIGQEQKDQLASNSILGELAINSMGMFLYFSLALLGCLIMFGMSATPMRRAFVLLSVVVLSIGFFPSMVGLSVIDHRWWYYAEALMAIPLGIALVSLASTKHWQMISVTALVVVLVFLSTIGLMSNMTNRTLSPNLTVRYALTENEMKGLVAIQEYDFQTLGTDQIYGIFVFTCTDIRVVTITKEIISGTFEIERPYTPDMLLLRKSLYAEPFGSGGGTIYILSYDPIELAKQQGYHEIWRNDEVICLVKK